MHEYIIFLIFRVTLEDRLCDKGLWSCQALIHQFGLKWYVILVK